jgi:hypothetical protein
LTDKLSNSFVDSRSIAYAHACAFAVPTYVLMMLMVIQQGGMAMLVRVVVARVATHELSDSMDDVQCDCESNPSTFMV